MALAPATQMAWSASPSIVSVRAAPLLSKTLVERTARMPSIAPAVMAAALLAFALSIDDYVVTSFVAGVGGVAYCVSYGKVEPLTGFLPGMKAFIAAAPFAGTR